jgi:serpin B
MSKIVGSVILLLGLFHFQSAFGMTGDHGCGLYELIGTIELNADDRWMYIVNKGSGSQFTFTVPIALEPKLAPYFEGGRTSKITSRFTRKIEGYQGEFASIESAMRIFADPLNLSNQKSLVLISEEKCLEPSPMADGGNAFALQLYQELADKPGNILFSPISISTALAMTYEGARGKTREQMSKVLNLGSDPSLVAPAYSKLLAELNSAKGKGVELHLANSIWTSKLLPTLQQDFLRTLDQDYAAKATPVEFSNSEAAAKTINDWVSDQTNKRINSLVSANQLDLLTKMVLTNAIYLKADWLRSFDQKLTKELPFYLAEGRSVTAPFMHQVDYLRMASDESSQLLELPYTGSKFAFYALLPRSGKTLRDIEDNLDLDHLKKLDQALILRKVQLYLPRFKAEQSLSLKDQLKNIGMSDAFSEEQADFSGISIPKWPYISAVLHKARLQVDEKGSEAAAATAVVMAMPKSAGRNDQEWVEVFRADRPFIYMIRDKQSGSILFMGRMVNPK